jgi:hypothetical protein
MIFLSRKHPFSSGYPPNALTHIVKMRVCQERIFFFFLAIPHIGIGKSLAKQMTMEGFAMTREWRCLLKKTAALFAAAIALLLVAALAVPATLFAAPPLVPVPQVTGLTGAAAKLKIENAGLKVAMAEGSQTTNPSQQGKVSHIAPAAGTKVPKGSVVAVYTYRYSTDVTVPNVVGMSMDQARLTLEKAGLQFKLAAKPTPTTNQAQAGKVAAQNPVSGSRLAKGKAVQVSPFAFTAPKRK